MKANLKAVQGDLFFLEKYIFFVSKQPTLIELSDIHSVMFSRISATSRTFDMKIVTKSGPEYNFTSINKEEHEPTETYLKDKKIKVKNETVPDAELLMKAAVGDDEDEEMASVSSDDGGRPKPSRNRGDDDDSEEDGSVLTSYLVNVLMVLQRTSRRRPQMKAHLVSQTCPMAVQPLHQMLVVTRKLDSRRKKRRRLKMAQKRRRPQQIVMPTTTTRPRLPSPSQRRRRKSRMTMPWMLMEMLPNQKPSPNRKRRAMTLWKSTATNQSRSPDQSQNPRLTTMSRRRKK